MRTTGALIIFVFLLSASLFSQEKKDYIFNVSLGPFGPGIGYEKKFDDFKYNMNLSFLRSLGVHGNFLFRVFKSENELKHYAGFTAGANIFRELDDKRFFAFFKMGDDAVTFKNKASLFGGVIYQMEYKNFYITPGAVMGTGSFASPRFVLSLGYRIVF